MILVYVDDATPRVGYSVRLVFDELLGQKFRFASDSSEFIHYSGPKVLYSREPHLPGGVFVQSSEFLSEFGIRKFVPDCKTIGGLPALFPSAHKDCLMGFDVFAAVFYLVSRYGEYLPHQKDAHGRFAPEGSFADVNGFLEVPLVDIYGIRLQEILATHYPEMIFSRREYSFIPTYDIDVAYAYKGRGLLRTAGAALHSLVHPYPGNIIERAKVLAGACSDPFDTYLLLEQYHKKYGLVPFYFFLCANPGAYDHNINIRSTAFSKLVKWADIHGHVGIHPSYNSLGNPKTLTTEILQLSKHLSGRVQYSRQHYLKVELPQTYRMLIRENILHDFSMGYASRAGFMASIATPFRFYDLGQERETSLRVYPLTVMDGTLRDYLGLSPGEAVDLIKRLIKQVRMVQGTFISLWHNDSLSERGRWAGWREVYEQLLDLANPGRPNP